MTLTIIGIWILIVIGIVLLSGCIDSGDTSSGETKKNPNETEHTSLTGELKREEIKIGRDQLVELVGIDKDENGLYDCLNMSHNYYAEENDTYFLAYVLFKKDESTSVTQKMFFKDLVKGINTINLCFDGYLIKKSEIDGPYRLSLSVRRGGLEIFYNRSLALSPDYKHSDFEDLGIELDSSESLINAIDINDDGLYDELTLIISLNSKKEFKGFIRPTLSGNSIVPLDYTLIDINKGKTDITLTLNSTTIRRSCGKFKIILQITDGNYYKVGKMDLNTSYNSREFASDMPVLLDEYFINEMEGIANVQVKVSSAKKKNVIVMVSVMIADSLKRFFVSSEVDEITRVDVPIEYMGDTPTEDVTIRYVALYEGETTANEPIDCLAVLRNHTIPVKVKLEPQIRVLNHSLNTGEGYLTVNLELRVPKHNKNYAISSFVYDEKNNTMSYFNEFYLETLMKNVTITVPLYNMREGITYVATLIDEKSTVATTKYKLE